MPSVVSGMVRHKHTAITYHRVALKRAGTILTLKIRADFEGEYSGNTKKDDTASLPDDVLEFLPGLGEFADLELDLKLSEHHSGRGTFNKMVVLTRIAVGALARHLPLTADTTFTHAYFRSHAYWGLPPNCIPHPMAPGGPAGPPKP